MTPTIPDPDKIPYASIPRIFYTRTWLVLFPDGAEHLRRYQVPVNVERVLSEHHAAIAAVPIVRG